MKIIGVIPARMSSSRFPGKPLAKIAGQEMLCHVYQRSIMSPLLNNVYVATCDTEIRDYCLQNNMLVIMTKASHQRATDRTTEAVKKIEKAGNKKADIVVMIQGDEPMVFPQMIESSVKPLIKEVAIRVTNLMAPVVSRKEQVDPNTIKVVVDKDNNALYFSREPIPSLGRAKAKSPVFKQVCVIAFRRDFLFEFSALSPTPLEVAESIDMLRIIEHGLKIKMVATDCKTQSVDTIQDLKKVERLIKNDPLLKKYAK